MVGDELYGEAASDNFGTSVALNEDGSIVAAGSELNDAGGTSAGSVRVYEYDSSSDGWVQMGSDIDGAMINERFGRTLAISDLGTTLAIGGERSSIADTTWAGVVRVYEYSGTAWSQLGDDLLGDTKQDYSAARWRSPGTASSSRP